ncbi:hypothetical protein DIPPA_32763 [Diplonema papillatum]|nr:hypothetical protein DIPPA_06032 [Diplonema papillatum]KAJ9470112.1 hypothetical protein DIPPA_32763 [Diplonema papillatum]
MPRPTYSDTEFETKTKVGTPLLTSTRDELIADWTLLKEVLRRRNTPDAVFQAFAPQGCAGTRMPALQVLVELAQTVVTSSAESERQFSTLARVKTRLRNRLLNTTLWAMFRIVDADNKEMSDETAEEVIDLFAQGLSAVTLRTMYLAGDLDNAPEGAKRKRRKIGLSA